MFVPIAEDSRAIVAIGRWVLHEACRTLLEDRWPSVNINVSMRQLYSPTFVEEVRQCLRQSGIAPQRLRFEVTESVIMNSDDPGPITALRAISDLGVLVVMDDFGTGYSNLAALGRMPLHELKLAATFLESVDRDFEDDAADLQILGTVVDLAHNLGLIVTAEGVETTAQDLRIRQLGCDVGQGWYYASAAPLPA
jgi:EAL domain-containing protein (putative c-di-GMP-specific phosphodiesterase class I)